MYFIEKVDIEALDDYPIFESEYLSAAIDQCRINCESYTFKDHEASVAFEVYNDRFDKFFEFKKFNIEPTIRISDYVTIKTHIVERIVANASGQA